MNVTPRCRYCTQPLGRTKGGAVVCPHCDVGHVAKGCARCDRMFPNQAMKQWKPPAP